MKYTEQQIEEMAKKSAQWDALAKKIESVYGHEDEENGEWIENMDDEEGLITIGEMAASAFGWL